MSYCVSILPEILLLVMLTSAFGILTFISTKILRQTGLFQKKTAVSMAFLISVAATVGSAQLLLMPNSSPEANHMRSVTVYYSMLPFVTMAGVIVMLLLFVIAAATAPAKTGEAPGEKSDLPVVKSKTPGRPKKEKPAEKPSKEATKTAGEVTKKAESHS
jgi:hypothetical protein